jgi:hypothetical protein
VLRARVSPSLAAACLIGLFALGCGERSEPEITASTTGGEEFSILGEWSGRLEQRGIKPFPIRAAIESLERSKANTVTYGGEIGCSGTWDYLGANETSYRFREVIDRGRGGKCKGKGTVTLTPLTADRLDYRFAGGGIASAGELSRR